MPMQTSNQVLHDGVRNLVMQFTGLCDGTGGETGETKVRASDLSPVGDSQIKIKRVEFSVNGGILRITWNSNDPNTFLDLEGQGFYDYWRHGGAQNSGVGSDVNGDILFTTYGFDSGSNYSVKLEMQKS